MAKCIPPLFLPFLPWDHGVGGGWGKFGHSHSTLQQCLGPATLSFPYYETTTAANSIFVSSSFFVREYAFNPFSSYFARIECADRWFAHILKREHLTKNPTLWDSWECNRRDWTWTPDMERVENQKICQRVLPSPFSSAQSGYQILYSIFVGGGNFPVFRGKRLVGGFESFVPFFSRVEGKLCVVVCLLSASNPSFSTPFFPFSKSGNWIFDTHLPLFWSGYVSFLYKRLGSSGEK